MLSSATPFVGTTTYPKATTTAAVEGLNPVLVDRLKDLIFGCNFRRAADEVLAGEAFYSTFPVRRWADALGGRALADVRVFARSIDRKKLFEFRVVPEDEYWYDRLRRDAVRAEGSPFDPDVSYGSMRLMVDGQMLGPDDMGLLRTRHRGQPLQLKLDPTKNVSAPPVPPLPSFAVPDATEGLAGACKASVPRGLFVDGEMEMIGHKSGSSSSSGHRHGRRGHQHEECAACAARAAHAESREHASSMVSGIKARLVERVCNDVARMAPGKVDYAAVSASVVRNLHAPDFYPGATIATRAGASASAAAAASGGYQAFWRQAGVRNPGTEITQIASDLAAAVCSLAPDDGQAADRALLRRELEQDDKLWARMQARWTSDRTARVVGVRRPLPAALSLDATAAANHGAHKADAHGLALDERARSRISSLIAAPLKRIACSSSGEYHASCLATARDKRQKAQRAAGGGYESSSSDEDDVKPTRASLQCRKSKAHLVAKNRAGSVSLVAEQPHPVAAPAASAASAAAVPQRVAQAASPLVEGGEIEHAEAPRFIEAKRGGGAHPKQQHSAHGFGGFKGPSAQEFHLAGRSKRVELPLRDCPDCAPSPLLVGCKACGGKGTKKSKHAPHLEEVLISCDVCGGKGKAKKEDEEGDYGGLLLPAEQPIKMRFVGEQPPATAKPIEGSRDQGGYLVRVFNASPDKQITAVLATGAAFKPAGPLPGTSTQYRPVSRGDTIKLGDAAQVAGDKLVAARTTVYYDPDSDAGPLVLPDLVGPMPPHKEASVKLVNLRDVPVKAVLISERSRQKAGTFDRVEPSAQGEYIHVPANDFLIQISNADTGAQLAEEKVSLKHRNHMSIVVRRGASSPATTLLFDDRHEGFKAKLSSFFHRLVAVDSLLSDPKRQGILLAPADSTAGLEAHLRRIESSPSLLDDHFASGAPLDLLRQKTAANNLRVETGGKREFVFNDAMTGVFDASNKVRICHGIYPHPANPNVLVAVVEGTPSEFPEAD